MKVIGIIVVAAFTTVFFAISVLACTDQEFECVKDGYCIPLKYKCDFDNDCGDYSDETDCICDPPEARCNGYDNGTYICYPADFKCDGYADCKNEEDEENCPCDNDMIPCTSPPGPTTDEPECKFCKDCSICYPASWYCDGWQDCDDGSDEPEGQTCPPPTPTTSTTTAGPPGNTTSTTTVKSVDQIDDTTPTSTDPTSSTTTTEPPTTEFVCPSTTTASVKYRNKQDVVFRNKMKMLKISAHDTRK